jgi:hypothetical protein
MNRRHYGAAFAAFGIAALWAGGRTGASLLWCWPGAALLWVGLAYLTGRPSLFGKDRVGDRAVLARVVLFPYLALCRASWWLTTALDRRRAWHRLDDALYLGRMPGDRASLPGQLAGVVDLTAELQESSTVRAHLDYRCEPLLDAVAAAPADLERCLATLADVRKPALLHCALGSGRTAMVAAAHLLAEGRATRVPDALRMVVQARPGARPNLDQIRFLEAWQRQRARGV